MPGNNKRNVSSGSKTTRAPRRKRFLTRRKAMIGILVVLCLGVFIGWGWQRYRRRLRLLEMVKVAIANPDGLSPKQFLGRIDDNFTSLPEVDQKRIIADPSLLAEHIRQASYDNYKAAFGDLFKLPSPVRRKLIQRAADAVVVAMEKNPARVEAFYESEAGKAALRAASEYFFIELSGKQKAELKPLTDAFFKIQSQKGKH